MSETSARLNGRATMACQKSRYAQSEGRPEKADTGDALDAKRYRWLRAHQHIGDDGDGWLYLSFSCDRRYEELTHEERCKALDAALDAAIDARAKARAIESAIRPSAEPKDKP